MRIYAKVKASNKPTLLVPIEITPTMKGVLDYIKLSVEDWVKEKVYVGDTLLGEIYLELGVFAR